MLIYIFIISIIFLGSFKYLNTSKFFFVFILLITTLFFCFGYMNGSDWKAYEPMYEGIEGSPFYYNIISQPGYYIYMLMFKSLNIDFWHFLIFTKIISFSIFVFFIKRHSEENTYIVLPYFLVSFGLYYFIDNPIRNLIAATIFLFSFKHIVERNLLRYIGIVLIASLFHYTALVTLPFYYILNFDFKRKYWVISYVLIFLFTVFFKDQLISLIYKLFSTNPLFGGKISFYFKEMNFIDSRILTLGSLVKVIFFVLILKSKSSILLANRYGKVFFNGSMVFLLFNRLGSSIEVLSRLQMFTAVLFCITIVFISIKFVPSSKTIYFIFLITISYFTLYKEVTTTYKYIPYTNYLLFKNKNMHYNERINYNKSHSPYGEK